MLWEVERHGDDDHTEEEEQERIYSRTSVSMIPYAARRFAWKEPGLQPGNLDVMVWLTSGSSGALTEDEFFGRRQHVQREGDLCLSACSRLFPSGRGVGTSYWYLFLCSHRNVDANIVVTFRLVSRMGFVL